MKSAAMQMPKVIFIPCARSHRFERREIEVFEEVKVRRFPFYFLLIMIFELLIQMCTPSRGYVKVR